MAGPGRRLRRDRPAEPRGARAGARRAAVASRSWPTAMEISPLTAVATAAVREASDGPDFVAEVKRDHGHRALGDRRRGRGAAVGAGRPAWLARRRGAGLRHRRLVDGAGEIGDGRGRPAHHLAARSVPARRDRARQEGSTRQIAGLVGGLRDAMGAKPERLFLVGGSWRAIARLDMVRRGYPLHGAARIPHDPRERPRHSRVDRWPTTSRTCASVPTCIAMRGWRWCRSPARCCARLVETFKPGRASRSRATASARGCSTSRCRRRCATAIR